MVQNIIFDFGKVLIDFDFDEFIDNIFQDRKEEEKEFIRIFEAQEFVDECDLEMVPFMELIQQKKKLYPQFADELQYYGEHYTDCFTSEMEGMKALMTRLKQDGFHLYGLSNWSTKVFEVMEKFPEIFSLIEGYVVSCEEHIIKPDQKIYDRVCEKFKLNADECLFVDDKAINVDGAIRAGWHGIVFKNATQLEKDIKELNY